MGESRGVEVMQGKIVGKRAKGRPRKRWMDNISNDLEELGVRNWHRSQNVMIQLATLPIKSRLSHPKGDQSPLSTFKPRSKYIIS